MTELSSVMRNCAEASVSRTIPAAPVARSLVRPASACRLRSMWPAQTGRRTTKRTPSHVDGRAVHHPPPGYCRSTARLCAPERLLTWCAAAGPHLARASQANRCGQERPRRRNGAPELAVLCPSSAANSPSTASVYSAGRCVPVGADGTASALTLRNRDHRPSPPDAPPPRAKRPTPNAHDECRSVRSCPGGGLRSLLSRSDFTLLPM